MILGLDTHNYLGKLRPTYIPVYILAVIWLISLLYKNFSTYFARALMPTSFQSFQLDIYTENMAQPTTSFGTTTPPKATTGRMTTEQVNPV